MVNILALPYRDSYFYDKFGPAVRDLQIILALSENIYVSKITVINRPVSIYERLTTKRKKRSIPSLKIDTIDITSFNILGPIFRRKWFKNIYIKIIKRILPIVYNKNQVNILLDFSPISMINRDDIKGWFLWYDFIDNFIKHNRFSKREKLLVREKYNFIKYAAQFITAVTKECLENTDLAAHKNTYILNNCIFSNFLPSRNKERKDNNENIFDFGFIGFITNKFDLSFIDFLSRKGYSIAIYGKAFDYKVQKKLMKINNVYLGGAFSYSDLADICKTFRVGLLPYRIEKSHDGSPLKLYEYLRYGRPCLTSMDFEIMNENIVNYNNCIDIDKKIGILFQKKKADVIATIKNEWYLNYHLNIIINNIISLSTIT